MPSPELPDDSREGKRQRAEAPPAGFAEVIAGERAAIAEARRQSGIAAEAPLWGLALSGGGIRSATFNLGVLQALAQRRLLARFDYLSTVSGGGYIGGWLAALCHRFGGVRAVEAGLDGDPTRLAEATGDRDPITWLRDYSNYLTPRRGLLSGDSWAAIATYLRNLLLNLTALLCFLALVLLLPRWLYLASDRLLDLPGLCFGGALVLAALALLFVARNLAVFDRLDEPGWNSNRLIQCFVTLPLLTAAWLLVCSFAGPLDFGHLSAWAWGGWTALLYCGVWVAACGADLWRRRAATKVGRPGVQSWPAILLSAVPAGFLGGVYVGGIHHLLEYLRSSLFPFVFGQPLSVYHTQRAAALWVTLCVGPPLVVIGATLMAVLHLGLIGRSLADWIREWWARLGGSLLTASLFFWVPLLVIILYGPFLEAKAGPWLETFLASGWLLSTLGGILAGKSQRTGGPEDDRRLDWMARSAAYVFVGGFAVLLSLGLRAALFQLAQEFPKGSSDFLELAEANPRLWPHNVLVLSATSTWPVLLLATAGLGAVLLLLAWRLDINEFSMNPLYRNRLVRCYLGASNRRRRPERFTGFDPADDLPLAELGSARPYPLINAALNHVSGRKIAWRERKALPFLLSPLWCGYDIGLRGRVPEAGEPESGYRAAAEYASDPQELSLGTALAISGAAINPCMGYHSAPAVTFLLTLFNARLGWWLPNPRVGRAWRAAGPNWGLRYLLTELFGRTDFSRPHVHLSDGGHAENLGLYQLVKRGCPFVLVADATADSRAVFADFARSLRQCRIDLGIEIEIDLAPLRPDPATRKSAQGWVLGKIHYEAVDPAARPGVLLYLKATLTDSLPSDVASFAQAFPTFPHDSTANQWFTEQQFESYRLLGQCLAAAALVQGLPQEKGLAVEADGLRRVS
ncbi:MAG TPA: patatin-like phospholipase family protein [Thermoanaerobaculia bacterium]|jgi:hypothetical protein|nr:patatin-like phospholipase family protein [Thermoanaerobaculia bacterium]